MTSTTAQPAASTAAAAAAPAAVRAVKLGLWIDERPILRELSFEIAPGSFVALLGANGAGKSTLLRVLAMLTPPTRGEFHLFGQRVKRTSVTLRAKLGMIGHQAMLYRDLSARENLEFFGKLYGVRDPRKRAAELLEMVGLADRATDPIKAFSRGMTQRIAIARALMHDPDLLLADEPFAGLDAPSTDALEILLRRLHERGKTIVLVNHDIGQSLRLAHRALVLRKGRVALDKPTTDLDAAGVLREVVG